MGQYETAVARFREWLDLARETEGILEPTAMTLATATASGRPSARTVLLKQVDEDGFVFYTNSLSRKGRQLAANARAALTFFWAPLMRQVMIEGTVQPVSDVEADAYFASRPRLSQIGAWASQQSEPLAGREAFDASVAEVEARFADMAVTRPPHWTGYRVRPDMIEFWQGREGRLHDRERYYRGENGTWEWTLLNP
ncbi:pyridoxamine 5'-phosphate oxidase [Spiribacter sp. 221]